MIWKLGAQVGLDVSTQVGPGWGAPAPQEQEEEGGPAPARWGRRPGQWGNSRGRVPRRYGPGSDDAEDKA